MSTQGAPLPSVADHPAPADPTWPLLIGLSAAFFLFEMIPSLFSGYGYFIDEFYYLACARRLDFGYVDHPPLAPFLLRMNSWLLGESIPSIRLLPALCGAATVLFSGWLAALLGGGRLAQGLTALAVFFCPVFLVMSGIFSMNTFGILLWIGLITVLILMIRYDEPRLWLAFGVLAGVGLENKHTIVLLGLAVVLSLALTPARKYLASRWLWLGGLVALVLFVPNLIWQIQNGWPSLEFYSNQTALKNIPTPPWEVIAQQILFMNPMSFPVWAAGLWFFLFSRSGRPLRAIGWIYVVLLTVMIVLQSSRPDRIMALYPVLFAAGGVVIERLSRRKGLRWVGVAFIVALVAGGLAFAPIALPLLPPANLVQYFTFLGINTQIERGEGKQAELPQWLADRFGWQPLVDQVSGIYRDLSPSEQAGTIILAPSYGHAGAIELLGSELDLPPVVSPHNTYHSWGRETFDKMSPEVIIALDFGPQTLEDSFEEVEQVALYQCQYCMNWRNQMPIYIARGPKRSKAEFRQAWEKFKHYE